MDYITYCSHEERDIIFNHLIETIEYNSKGLTPVEISAGALELQPIVEETKAEPSTEANALLFRWKLILTHLPKIISDYDEFTLETITPNRMDFSWYRNSMTIYADGTCQGFVDRGNYVSFDDTIVGRKMVKILRKELIKLFNLGGLEWKVYYLNHKPKMLMINAKFEEVELLKIKTKNATINYCEKDIKIIEVYPDPPIDFTFTPVDMEMLICINSIYIRPLPRTLECPVCLEQCNNTLGLCGHPLCGDCYSEICRSGRSLCPLCRASITSLD